MGDFSTNCGIVNKNSRIRNGKSLDLRRNAKRQLRAKLDYFRASTKMSCTSTQRRHAKQRRTSIMKKRQHLSGSDAYASKLTV